MIKIIDDLFILLDKYGGRIQRSQDVFEEEVKQAEASNRLLKINDNTSYIWIPMFEDIFPQTDEDIDLFEQFYPLNSTIEFDSEKVFNEIFQKIKIIEDSKNN